jgi:tetratricopeptide (TPR) repeat protein
MAIEGVDLERCLERVEKHPGSAAAHYNLGLAYTQRGKVTSAETAYRKAVEIDPDLVEAWVNLGGVLMLQWKFEDCLKANQEAIERKDDLVLAHYNSGQASLYLGDAQGVVRSSLKVLELDPDHASGCYYLGVGLLSLGRIEEALAAVARAKGLGHSPAPEFLRELKKAVTKLESEENEEAQTEAGGNTQGDENRR